MAHERVRGTLGSCVQLMVVLGIMGVYLAGTYLCHRTLCVTTLSVDVLPGSSAVAVYEL